MKRVVLVHGWDGTPESGWFPWLKKELEAHGYIVLAPQLPDTETPKIDAWVPALAGAVGTVDEETYFIGHSMGCETIARYLATLPENVRVGGVVYVAGFFKRLTNLEGPESEAVAAPWLGTFTEFARVRTCAPKSTAFFSDDDPWVPLDNQDDFRGGLGSHVIVEHAKGHWSGDRDKCREVPNVLAAFLTLTGTR